MVFDVEFFALCRTAERRLKRKPDAGDVGDSPGEAAGAKETKGDIDKCEGPEQLPDVGAGRGCHDCDIVVLGSDHGNHISAVKKCR